tara:strand:+ start:1074 stop:1322 length:249 start_codon:yes stop_codon:yes gene_type:complete
MGKGIENRGSQVHRVRRDDLLAKEAKKEIELLEFDRLNDWCETLKVCGKCGEKITDELKHISKCKKFGENVQTFFNELHESL